MHKMHFSSGRFGLKAVAIAVLSTCAVGVHAYQVETDNPDVTVRWDNQIRFNAGWRVNDADTAILKNVAFDESDSKFKKAGDMITRRVDWLSDLDIAYKRDFGLRLSTSAWQDDAYSDTSTNGFGAQGSSYNNNQYSEFTKRYQAGPSGEILDAFVWGNFDAGSVPINVKAGRFSTFWGNSVFFAGGIARGQQPIDGRKSAVSPGSEVKEVFLPLAQISATAQATPHLSVTAQYYMDWATTRGADGGTYYGSADFAIEGPDKFGGAAVGSRLDPLTPDSKSGNFGVNARWSPESLDGDTIGAYYRKYDEKTPSFFLATGGYRAVYARDAELFGLSYDTKIGSVSTGFEFGYHQNVGLSSQSLAGVTFNAIEPAKGNTYHLLANGVYGLPSSFLWPTGTFVAELSYTKLDSVTKNPTFLTPKVGTAACVNKSLPAASQPGSGNATDGCLTDDAWGIGMSLTPSYAQVLPGLDIDVPMTLNYGIVGNSASALGTSEGVASFSIGMAMKIFTVHNLNITYAGSRAPSKTNAAGVASSGNGSYSMNDRDRLTVMYKYSF